MRRRRAFLFALAVLVAHAALGSQIASRSAIRLAVTTHEDLRNTVEIATLKMAN